MTTMQGDARMPNDRAIGHEIKEEYRARCRFGSISLPIEEETLGAAARAVLASPREERVRMQIEGMSVDQIETEMQMGRRGGTALIEERSQCARVAHRLANTPAAQADPDARAKAMAGRYWRRAQPHCSDKSNEQIWSDLPREQRDAWRTIVIAAAAAAPHP